MDKTYYHSFLLYKLRQYSNSNIIEVSKIKQILGRFAVRTGGLPRWMVRYILEDMIALNLIVKITNERYRILNSPLEKRIKALVLAI